MTVVSRSKREVTAQDRSEPAELAATFGQVATVTDIDIDRSRAMTLTFDDGRTCVFDVRRLRIACPCAGCRGMRDRGEAPWPRPGQSDEIRIEQAELVGAWGISLHWSDGHSTGIYSWDALRRWCDSGLDAGLVVDLPDADGSSAP
jgi:DUF971 family protein